MNRIDALFERIKPHKALISYITAGDPDLDETLRIMLTLADNGTDIIELGVPFSDPMADGAIIQRAAQRAVEKGVSLRDVLELVRRFREHNQTTPVVLMGYLNPVFHIGYENFARTASEAGADGVLTVDSPAEMSDELSGCLKKYGLAMIFLIAPTTDDERIKTVTQHASGFIYYVSLKGVTGSAALDVNDVKCKIEHLRKFTDLPLAVGFGIKTAEDAHKIAQIADAVVVGSRFVQTIEQYADNPASAAGSLSNELKSAISI